MEQLQSNLSAYDRAHMVESAARAAEEAYEAAGDKDKAEMARNIAIEAKNLADQVQKPNNKAEIARATIKIATEIAPIVSNFLVPGSGELVKAFGSVLGILFEDRSTTPQLTREDVEAAVVSALSSFNLEQEKFKFRSIAEVLNVKMMAYNYHRELALTPELFGEGWGSVFALDRTELSGYGTQVESAWLSMVGGTGSFLYTNFNKLKMFDEKCYETCNPDRKSSRYTIAEACKVDDGLQSKFNQFYAAVVEYQYVTVQMSMLNSVIQANAHYLQQCAPSAYETYEFALASYFFEVAPAVSRGRTVESTLSRLKGCYALTVPEGGPANAKWGDRTGWWPWEQHCSNSGSHPADMVCNYAYANGICGSPKVGGYNPCGPNTVNVDPSGTWSHSDAAERLAEGCRKNEPMFGVGHICGYDSDYDSGNSQCANPTPPSEFTPKLDCGKDNLQLAFPNDLCGIFSSGAFGTYYTCASPNYCVIPNEKVANDGNRANELRQCIKIFTDGTQWL